MVLNFKNNAAYGIKFTPVDGNAFVIDPGETVSVTFHDKIVFSVCKNENSYFHRNKCHMIVESEYELCSVADEALVILKDESVKESFSYFYERIAIVQFQGDCP